MSIYSCDTGTIQAIGLDDCPETFGQANRAIFQRPLNGGVPNTISISDSSHLALSTYQTLIGATDDTKLVVSPIFANPVPGEAEIRTFGQGNVVPSGVPINLGDSPSSFSVTFYAKKQFLMRNMKRLPTNNIAVYLVDHLNRIMGIADDPENPTLLSPIPIFNLATTSATLGGYEGPDTNNTNWSFFADWSDNRIIFKPSFAPLTDL